MVSNGFYFTSSREIYNLFRSGRQDVSTDALKSLRNQLNLKSGETSISPQDPRIILVKEWLELSPGAQDIFVALDKHLQPAAEGLFLSILSSLISLTSQHLVYQPLGYPIVRTLLTPRWLRKLNSYLSGGHFELCLVTLKLLNALSSFAAGKEQKNLLESFPWDLKVFQKILHMRRREKDLSHDALVRPDIRTLCLQFILSFVSASSHIKGMFLEHRRDVFLAIFKEMDSDPPSVVRYILETLWTQLWQDQKLKKSVKVALFGEKTMQQLLRLYDRSEEKGTHPENVPANIVHHFLLAICTHRGVGVCFADNGWYPRQENERDASERDRDRIHNKILGNVLKMLKVNDDGRQQELALKILSSCPELVAGYLQFLTPMLEPRLSSRWLASMAFFGAILSLPVPLGSFYLPSTTPSSSMTHSVYRPDPPPLSIIINNIIPSPLLKTHLTKAIQSSHLLLQHSAGLLLSQCLVKYEAVQDTFRTIKVALEEDVVEGQWTRRLGDIDREVRKRIPDVNVVIAFANAQQLTTVPTIKASILSELSQRLLWLYHHCATSLIVEARYDPSKSLRALLLVDEDQLPTSSEIQGLNRLRQLHVLRMLMENDQFVWHAKTAPSGPSNLHILLQLFLTAKHPSIRQAVTRLLSQALRDSLLFQHDPDELYSWLDALPTTIRSSDAEAPDDARLADERQCVISFLEACMQRCSKTPHRYIEELGSFVESSDSTSCSVSPIITTILEQLHAKMRGKTLEPSDTLSLTTFLRKVIVGLLGKQLDHGTLYAIASKLRAIVTGNDIFTEFPTITNALGKECSILDNCLAWCASRSPSEGDLMDMSPSDTVKGFVSLVERQQSGVDGQSSLVQAYELVDWIRLLDQPLSSSIVRRVAAVVKQYHAPALTSFCLHLTPGSGFLWALPEDDIANWVPMEWILLHWNQESITWSGFTSVMQSALRKRCRTLHQYKSLVGLLNLRLRHWHESGNVGHVLEMLAIIMKNARLELPPAEFITLKFFGLSERQQVQQLACALDLPVDVASALERLQGLVLDPGSESDRLLASPISAHWVATLSGSFRLGSWQNLARSHMWIKFMSPHDLLAVTEHLFQILQDSRAPLTNSLLSEFVRTLFEALACCKNSNDLLTWMRRHLRSFLALYELPTTITALDKIILRCVDAGPIFGCSEFSFVRSTLHQAIEVTENYWTSRLSPLPREASVIPLLSNSDWSLDHSTSVASFLYRSPAARRSFWSWLCSGALDEKPAISKLAPAMHAVLDSSTGAELLEAEDTTLVTALFHGLAEDFFGQYLENQHSLVGSCLAKMTDHFRSRRADFVKILCVGVTALAADTLHSGSLRLFHSLPDTPEFAPFAVAVVNHALRWAAQYLSESKSQNLRVQSLAAVTNAVRFCKDVPGHYAEPVVEAAIRHHVCSADSMHLADALLAKITLKPVIVNRLIQGVLQHSDFIRLASFDPACEEREAISRLLTSLFLAHPANTCQPSHIQPLVQLYSGTMSSADRQILSIFHLFEEQRRASVASIITQWSHANLSDQGTPLDAMLSLDPARVFRTCLSLPIRRGLFDEDEDGAHRLEFALLYDPVFVLLLFAQMRIHCPPKSALAWVSVYRTNAVCLIIRCLSSTVHAVRKIAILQLGGLYKDMQGVDMQEKPHVIHLLDLCRDHLEDPSGHHGEVKRLPSYTALFFAHALRGIFYPANFIYPHTARFLLQRPQIDIRDIPLLYSMLYGNGDDWRKERGWIVRFLVDGMQSNDDWRLLKRRHTWDLLASMFQASYGDTPLRRSILEFLANLTCQPRPAAFLIRRFSLVHWIESQLLTMKDDESTAWAKIIENILVVVDIGRIEPMVKDEILNGLLRCLSSLMSNSDIALLRLVSRCLARLDNESVSASSVNSAIKAALKSLSAFEGSNMVLLPTDAGYQATSVQKNFPPYHGPGLHQPLFENSIETWGRTVESLWSVSLIHGIHGPIWHRLTERILVWRALVGEQGSPTGEWARREALFCLLHRDEGVK